jgi:hypothetical protein
MLHEDYDELGEYDYDTKSVAWRMFDNRKGKPAPWSKLHETNDNGMTTLCGVTVPESYDSDNYGDGKRCARCKALRKAGQ